MQHSFSVASAGSDVADFLADVDVVCVDPPRKGLDPALLQALCCQPAGSTPLHPETRHATANGSNNAIAECDAHTLIYLSCGYKALERDCKALLGSRQWRLVHCEAFAFFPGTDSLETLAVFQRTT